MNGVTIIFLPGAETDLGEIVSWYELQSTGLSFDFLEDLDLTIKRIKRNPKYSFNIGDGIRRASLKRFPFYVIFTIAETEVRVHSILHQHRNPDEWQKWTK